jgi:uncharacterized protein (TIGR03437 family)
VAPGEIVTIYGSKIGPSTLATLSLTAEGRVDTTLAETRILFNGVPSPLIYVSDQQSSAVVPNVVAGQHAVDVQVEYQGVLSDSVTMPVLDSRLGVFSAEPPAPGKAAIVNEDGSINAPAHPAPRGSVVSIYATGGGLLDPPLMDGVIAGKTLSRLKSPILVTLTNQGDPELECFSLICADVLYAGSVPGSIDGLIQINARLPLTAPAGDAVPLHVGTEQALTIAIR